MYVFFSIVRNHKSSRPQSLVSITNKKHILKSLLALVSGCTLSGNFAVLAVKLEQQFTMVLARAAIHNGFNQVVKTSKNVFSNNKPSELLLKCRFYMELA